MIELFYVRYKISIEITISNAEIDTIFWKAAASGEPTGGKWRNDKNERG